MIGHLQKYSKSICYSCVAWNNLCGNNTLISYCKPVHKIKTRIISYHYHDTPGVSSAGLYCNILTSMNKVRKEITRSSVDLSFQALTLEFCLLHIPRIIGRKRNIKDPGFDCWGYLCDVCCYSWKLSLHVRTGQDMTGHISRVLITNCFHVQTCLLQA